MRQGPVDFQWSELNTHEPQAARSFFEANFGWRFSEAPTTNDTYLIAVKGDKPVAGIFTLKGPDADHVPSHWQNYTPVPDIEQACEQTCNQGGQVLRAPLAVPNVGRIAILKQANGEVVGMITPDTRH
ncbi:MAG: VOC family protein [Rhodobacteraceae bacterium]|nr:VOC family protein [Paracoccaceae bacterium]